MKGTVDPPALDGYLRIQRPYGQCGDSSKEDADD